MRRPGATPPAGRPLLALRCDPGAKVAKNARSSKLSNNPDMKFAIYSNIGNKRGQDTADQLAQLRRYALSQDRAVRLFVDRQEGQTGERAEFQQLFAAAAHREFQVLLVWSLDRFVGDSVAEVFGNIQRLLRYDVQVVSFSEKHFRTSGPAGELILPIATWIAQQQHLRISERTKAGLARARAHGKPLGRPWKVFPWGRVAADRQRGMSWRQLERKYHVPQSSLRNAMQRREALAAARVPAPQDPGGLALNGRLSALRKLVAEAADNGMIPLEVVASIARVRGVGQRGVRLGNWLDRRQAERLLQAPNATTLAGQRDRALLAVLLGCGLRRPEAVALTFAHIQQRQQRWVIVDLVGKHGRVRSVPMPGWAKAAIECWSRAARIQTGRVFRPINRGGRLTHASLTDKSIWWILRKYTPALGLPHLAPHDLRRSYAKLAHHGHAPIEQIQISLGHASIQTTERYLGVKQDLGDAPCDHLGLKLGPLIATVTLEPRNRACRITSANPGYRQMTLATRLITLAPPLPGRRQAACGAVPRGPLRPASARAGAPSPAPSLGTGRPPRSAWVADR